MQVLDASSLIVLYNVIIFFFFKFALLSPGYLKALSARKKNLISQKKETSILNEKNADVSIYHFPLINVFY